MEFMGAAGKFLVMQKPQLTPYVFSELRPWVVIPFT